MTFLRWRRDVRFRHRAFETWRQVLAAQVGGPLSRFKKREDASPIHAIETNEQEPKGFGEARR